MVDKLYSLSYSLGAVVALFGSGLSGYLITNNISIFIMNLMAGITISIISILMEVCSR